MFIHPFNAGGRVSLCNGASATLSRFVVCLFTLAFGGLILFSSDALKRQPTESMDLEACCRHSLIHHLSR